VRFLSAKEMIAPPPLQDVQVKPGSYAIVNPEQQFEPMLDLSTVIRVWQGRAIVARRLTTVEQVSWSLPTPLSTGGVLPRAQTQDGQTKVIVLNPSDTPARISAQGFADDSTIPLQNFDVDANARTSFVVNSFAPAARGVVLNVRAGHSVAVESLVVPKGRRELSLFPAMQPDRRWVVPLAESRRLVVLNPGDRPVQAEFDRLGDSGSHTTATIPPHRIYATGLAGPGEFGLLLRADRPVTVVAAGPAGAVAGVPF
jgi:hypothetical protein